MFGAVVVFFGVMGVLVAIGAGTHAYPVIGLWIILSPLAAKMTYSRLKKSNAEQHARRITQARTDYDQKRAAIRRAESELRIAIEAIGTSTQRVATPDSKGQDTLADPSAVLFNGVYRAMHGDYSSYLRFYADGVVLEVGSTGSPTDVGQWLGRDRDDLGRGRYTLNGSTVRFAVTSGAGTVDYEGNVDESGRLELRSHSHINGHRSQNEYSFVHVDFSVE
ncbi:MAG: hypothetical protein ACRDZT_09360 [Acidimicrobiales bacterium]